MAPSRAFVPSGALIRALSRPLPQRCPLARPLPARFTRGKRTRANKPDKAPVLSTQMAKDFERVLQKADADDDGPSPPLSDKELKELESDSGSLPDISFYEQDLDRGTPPVLVRRIATVQDWKEEDEFQRMVEESETNADYDDTALKHRLVDRLIANPHFADRIEDLKYIKEGIQTKEEREAEEREEDEDMELDQEESLRIAIEESLQELIDDPAASAAKAELQELVDRMPDIDDLEGPEFQAMLEKAMSKLNDDPTFQAKLASVDLDAAEAEVDKEFAEFERMIKEEIKEDDDDDELPNLDKALEEISDLTESIDDEPPITAELEAILAKPHGSEGPTDLQKIAQELLRLESEPDISLDDDQGSHDAQTGASDRAMTFANRSPPEEPDDDEADVPPELRKKVDEIMKDPRLVEKLTYIESLIAEQQGADLPPNPSAPDPTKLPSKRLTTIGQQIQAARSDPTHAAALARLRVHLRPPYTVSPELKSFNQAIELAYIGANDDIRRILWRSYSKARTVPTFLEGLSDEAWDILYYSQAVEWGSNQNRIAHLRTLLADLKKVGREGPPTRPEWLMRGKDLEG